jgi:hypothetical protein
MSYDATPLGELMAWPARAGGEAGCPRDAKGDREGGCPRKKKVAKKKAAPKKNERLVRSLPPL